MGLDMYFNAVTESENGRTTSKEASIYWRKANQIFKWFEDNLASVGDGEIQNCADYFVTREEMEKLRDVCRNVLEKRDPDYSKENLPTQSGFFFGSTEYDDDYYDDVQSTFNNMNALLRDPGVIGGIFHAWW